MKTIDATITNSLIVGDTTNNVVLNSSGKIGIKKSDPEYELDINGQQRILATNTPQCLILKGNNSTYPSCYIDIYNKLGTGRMILGVDGTGLASENGIDGILGTWTNTNLKFFTNTTEKMRITNDGKVGINKSDPQYNLDINGQQRILTTTTPQCLILKGNNTTYPSCYIDIYNKDGTGRMILGVDGTGLASENGIDGIIGTWTNTNLKFFTNTSEKMRITNDGNIGLGTTSPNVKLDVYGSVSNNIVGRFSNANPFTWISLKNTTDNGSDWLLGSCGTNSGFGKYFMIYDNTNSAGRLAIDNTGKVGLGAVAPLHNLAVVGSNPTVCFSGTTENDSVKLLFGTPFNNYQSGAYKSGIIAQGGQGWSTHKLHFCVNGSVGGTSNDQSNTASVNDAKMTIIPNGNVGIGTTGPPYTLSVQGIISNASNPIVSFGGYGSQWDHVRIWHDGATGYLDAGGADSGLAFRVNNLNTAYPSANYPEAMRILPDGKVGIGSSSPEQNFSVVGSNPSICFSGTSENDNVKLYFGTPFNGYRTSANKTAIIAEGTQGYSRNKLHFCLNNVGPEQAPDGNDKSRTADIRDARMTITPNGNVGIGKTNPSTTLDVNGAASVNSLLIRNPDYTRNDTGPDNWVGGNWYQLIPPGFLADGCVYIIKAICNCGGENTGYSRTPWSIAASWLHHGLVVNDGGSTSTSGAAVPTNVHANNGNGRSYQMFVKGGNNAGYPNGAGIDFKLENSFYGSWNVKAYRII